MGAARGIADDGTITGGDGQTTSSEKTAKQADPTKGRRMTITGTHGYRAPEVRTCPSPVPLLTPATR
eukprot:144043-Prymnesium_polylepis.1